MFTGIVEELGRVEAVEGPRLTVASELAVLDSPTGASVAVNGVCLTVVENTETALAFEISEETFDRTTLGRLRPGDPVNLERPVTLTARMGGHMVQGHVDGVGTVTEVTPQEGGTTIRIALPGGLERYVVEKGSITVDGVSLTITGVDDQAFGVALIPHTLDVTTLGTVRPGDAVNVEVDVLAKYVERLLDMAQQQQMLDAVQQLQNQEQPEQQERQQQEPGS
jgi:riboflavin synthase